MSKFKQGAAITITKQPKNQFAKIVGEKGHITEVHREEYYEVRTLSGGMGTLSGHCLAPREEEAFITSIPEHPDSVTMGEDALGRVLAGAKAYLRSGRDKVTIKRVTTKEAKKHLKTQLQDLFDD